MFLTSGFSLPTSSPGSRYESMGSRKSCSSLLGSSQNHPPNQGSRSQSTWSPPRWTTVSRAGRSGWAGVLHTFPHRSAVCPSLISPVFHQQGPLLHLTRPSQNPQDYKGTGRYGKPGQEGGRPHPHRGQLMLHRLTLSPPGCQWEGPGAGIGPGPPQQLLQFQCEYPGVPAAPPLHKVGTPPS